MRGRTFSAICARRPAWAPWRWQSCSRYSRSPAVSGFICSGRRHIRSGDHGFRADTACLIALTALSLMGAGDMVSVYVRGLLVQLETPDAIRGRVSAVSSIAIGASNELGEFESGTTAALFGLVPAIVLGGVVTLTVAVLWAKVFFPMLWRLQTFQQLKDHETNGTARTS